MPNQSEIDRNALIFDWNLAGGDFAPGRGMDPDLAAKQSNRLLEDQEIAALARGDDNP